MIKWKIIISSILLILLIIILGYYRDFLFTSINYRLRDLYYQTFYFQIPSSLSFLEEMSYEAIYRLKWMLTIVASILYLGLYLAVIKILFKERKYILWTIVAFAAIYILSGIFYFSGLVLGNLEKGYHFSRIFMGFIQSPLLLMLLIPAILLDRKIK